MSARAKVLECQFCGEVVKRLTEEEAQRVAASPYDFVVYCRGCQADAREAAIQGNLS